MIQEALNILEGKRSPVQIRKFLDSFQITPKLLPKIEDLKNYDA